jgi:S1-C subfamily serine protease
VAAGIREGDELLSVAGREATDIIEYQRLVDGSRVEMLISAG